MLRYTEIIGKQMCLTITVKAIKTVTLHSSFICSVCQTVWIISVFTFTATTLPFILSLLRHDMHQLQI